MTNDCFDDPQHAIYIAADTDVKAGQFLGDDIVSIAAAWCFASEWRQRHPQGRVILSLMRSDKWNCLWRQFIADFAATVIYDDWAPGDKVARYREHARRRAERSVDGIGFAAYRELYPRLDGGARQHTLCGHERGLGRANVVEYFWYGQDWSDCPCGVAPPASSIARQLPCMVDRSQFSLGDYVLISPREKCQRNLYFALSFWREVIGLVLAAGVPILLNDPDCMRDIKSSKLTRSFAGPEGLIEQVGRARVVACGNTGVGWLAGAMGVPLVACERVQQVLPEYRFALAGIGNLIVHETPDPKAVADSIIAAARR
jgi:hypothetical protein